MRNTWKQIQKRKRTQKSIKWIMWCYTGKRFYTHFHIMPYTKEGQVQNQPEMNPAGGDGPKPSRFEFWPQVLNTSGIGCMHEKNKKINCFTVEYMTNSSTQNVCSHSYITDESVRSAFGWEPRTPLAKGITEGVKFNVNSESYTHCL